MALGCWAGPDAVRFCPWIG